MAKDQAAFEQLLTSIADNSFVFANKGQCLVLKQMELNDPDVYYLMNVINANSDFRARLRGLIFNDNNITVAPDLRYCFALEYFLMTNNHMKIPPDFSRCPNMLCINLHGN